MARGKGTKRNSRYLKDESSGSPQRRDAAAKLLPTKSDTNMDWESARRTFQTALIWIAAAALAFALWYVRQGVLLVFGAIVLALLLHVFAAAISDWTRMPHGAALALATAVVIALVGFLIWRFGAQLSGQFTELVRNVESGTHYLQSQLAKSGVSGLGQKVTEKGTSFITNSLSNVVSTGLTMVEAAIVLIISAVYLAAQPKLYRTGFAKLFRPRHRARVMESLDLIGRTLKLWLLSQLILMAGVGVMSFVAVWLIGLPNAVALALLAGVLEIVPYLGPFISAIPAVLVALTLGLMPALWTVVAYVAI
ncbi:MAG TPA: AI-2E family transporter, partial [Pseudolabrys sp.]|nr:AI-2E family transporter [Pseudolabrys sp.]